MQCGIIGLGGMGEMHASIIKDSGLVELVALCDTNRQVLRKMAKQFEVESIYTDFHEIVANPSLDMVIICLPHYLHAPVALAALRAGKHVLTEKPIAISMEEADKMIETARQNNVKLGVSEEHRYGGHVQIAKKWIKEGKLGDLYLCSCTERFDSEIEQPAPQGWRNKKEMMGGGSYIDQGHHVVDLMRYIMGDPFECCAYMTRPTQMLEGEDLTLAIYRHSGGAISQVHVGWAPGITQSIMSIFGLKGTIIIDCPHSRYGFVSLFNPTTDDVPKPIERVEKDWGWATQKAIEKFIKAIEKDESPEYSGEEGKKNLAAILAAYRSAEKGISVKINYD
jgi:predicted dehydrogenase